MQLAIREGDFWLFPALSSDPAALATDDTGLMRRFRDGDGEAFALLYRRHGPGLHRFLARVARGRADADEIHQEVWLAVIRGRAHYTPQARFSTYLFAIAHRRLADRARQAMRHPVGDAAQMETLSSGMAGPLAILENEQLGAALQRAVGALPQPQRIAFLMQAEGGLSLAEIAQATGAPPETVKSRLRYATRALRQALGEWR